MAKQGAGKVALITGGSRGIGRGIARVMAQHGYDVWINHLQDEDNAQQLIEEIQQKYGTRCVAVSADLQEAGAAKRAVEQTIETMGRIDVVVNNAGITRFHSICDMPEEQIEALYRTNFLAPLLVIRAASSYMIEQGIAGSMINIASTRAERAYPLDAVYGGLKAGLKRATESIALELAPHRIRVNAIAPGAIGTLANQEPFYGELGAKIPLGRVGRPEDIGQAVLWLCSEQASYITGTTLRIDGGLILPGMPERGPGAGEFGWGRP